MESKKIKNFFKNRIKKIHASKEQGFDENKSWKMLLVAFTVVKVGVIIFSSYLFFRINSGEIFIVKQDTAISVDTINRTLLKDTIESFEKKAIEFEQLKTNRPDVIDPSL